jgi:competence protein ComEC
VSIPHPPRRLGSLAALALSLALILCLAACSPQPNALAPLDVYVLNVGKADAIIVGCGGQWMLVDAGLEETSGYVTAAMRALNIDSLTCAVATHPDKDHIGGMSAAIRAIPTRRLYEPPMRLDNKPSRAMRDALSQTGTPSSTVRSGDSWMLGDAGVHVIAPGKAALELNSENEASLVLMITHGSKRILLEADAQSVSENEMLSVYDDLRADVLKVAHHGSDKSTGEAFLAAVNPSIAVISTGERADGKDSDALPAPSTLSRLKSIGAAVYRTDVDGDIHIHSDGETITVAAE